MNKKIDIYIDFNAQSAIQSANNPISKCQNGTLKFFVRARPCSRKRTNKPPAMRVVEIALALCEKTPKIDII